MIQGVIHKIQKNIVTRKFKCEVQDFDLEPTMNILSRFWGKP